MKKLNELSIEELHTLYTIVCEICGDYSRMTDNYSLTTGDNKFEDVPEEFREMVEKRQKFFSYKYRIQNALINKVMAKMDNFE